MQYNTPNYVYNVDGAANMLQVVGGKFFIAASKSNC